MKLTLLASAAILALGIASGSAADMSARMPVKAAPYIAQYNWTGFYAGVNLGGAWSDGSGTVNTGTVTGSGSTFIYGGQIGYNWQAPGSNWVFGLETDIQGTSGNGSVSGQIGGVPFTGSSSGDYFGTFRGRVGYAWDRTLVYFTGGGVYGRAQGNVAGSLNGSASADYLTYTLGGGAEFALWDRWTLKAEYLYIGTPDDSPLARIPGVTALTGDVDTHVVRAGLNYRF